MATAIVYRSALVALKDKQWDWESDAFSAYLFGATFVHNQDTDDTISDLIGELSGGSYARVALTGKTTTLGSGTDLLTADPITFAAMTATNVSWMVIARNTGSDATSILLCAVQLDAPLNPTAQPIPFPLTSGVATMVAS